MDEYYHVIEALPPPLAEELGKLHPHYAPHIQEVRLRAGQPVQFTIKGRLVPCSKYLPGVRQAARISAQSLQECFLRLCRYSVYAYEEELRQGFFTIRGGNRVGVAGCWNGGRMAAVTSLNLRVARWVTCDLPGQVLEHLDTGTGGLLVAGAPGSGKTTFLRTLVEHLSRKEEIVCVVDERGELMAGESGTLPMAERMRCDVYSRCSKAEGICMALRCMNPQYIICDELGTVNDAAALELGIASGVLFLASVHCDSPQSLHQKTQLVRLLETGAFSGAVFLDGREKPGTVAQWVDLL